MCPLSLPIVPINFDNDLAIVSSFIRKMPHQVDRCERCFGNTPCVVIQHRNAIKAIILKVKKLNITRKEKLEICEKELQEVVNSGVPRYLPSCVDDVLVNNVYK